MKTDDKDKVFFTLMGGMLIALVILIGSTIFLTKRGFSLQTASEDPEPGTETVSLLDYLMYAEAMSIREAPNGKIYHTGDTIDLNDYLSQIDSTTDWNYTEGDIYTDSILNYYGVYWDDNKQIWSIK